MRVAFLVANAGWQMREKKKKKKKKKSKACLI